MHHTIKGTIQQARASGSYGYKDGGKKFLPCSNCKALLAEVWITGPEADIHWKVRVPKCPFCGDKSYWEEISGLITPAGYAAPHPTDPTDCLPSTRMTNFEHDDSGDGPILVEIHVEKDPNGRPYYR